MTSRRRRAKVPPVERNARGQRLCRVCREPLEKGQRAYCCRAHALEFGVRRSPELAGQLYRFRIGTWCVKCKADETVAREKWEQCRALLDRDADREAAPALHTLATRSRAARGGRRGRVRSRQPTGCCARNCHREITQGVVQGPPGPQAGTRPLGGGGAREGRVQGGGAVLSEELRGEMREINLRDDYVCPHPEEHDEANGGLCDACYARAVVLAWMANPYPWPEDET